MKSSTKPFPKTKIQWLWENMEGKRALYLIGMIGTVLYRSAAYDSIFFGKNC